VWKAQEQVANESLQRFYERSLFSGTTFRYHPDRADDARYWSHFLDDAGDFKPEQINAGHVGTASLWRVAYTMRRDPSE
jgi:hypothetical protein